VLLLPKKIGPRDVLVDGGARTCSLMAARARQGSATAVLSVFRQLSDMPVAAM
jgi:hypothetical protein